MTLLFTSNIFAQRAKKMELVSFVKEAQAFAQKTDFKAACDEFTNGKKFKKGEYYIFAYDFNGVCLCHGAKASLIGKDLSNLKDKKGNEIIKDFIKGVKSGKGFTKYYWEHPIDKKVKRKLGYGQKVNDKWWIGSGIYYEEK